MLRVSDYRTVGRMIFDMWEPLMQREIMVHTAAQCFTGTLTGTMPDWIVLSPDKNRCVLIAKRHICAVEYRGRKGV